MCVELNEDDIKYINPLKENVLLSYFYWNNKLIVPYIRDYLLIYYNNYVYRNVNYN